MASKKELEKQPNRTDAEAGEFAAFAAEDAEDRKVMRFSLWTAAGIHVLLLLINFPAFTAEPQEVEPRDRKVFVVQTPKFKPPPPPTAEPPPKPLQKRVPMPDPTPEDPEPLRVDEPKPELDLPYDRVIKFVIPDAPPVDEEPIGPIQVGGDVTAPVKLHTPQPQYTEIARKARIQGVVIVQAIIDKEGNVTNVKILKSLPMGLGEEAAKAIKSWKFKAATLNAKPVDVYYNLTVNFQLQ